MILTCPECSARYIVDPKALSPNGRLVRCAKCRHSWQEGAPDKDIPQVEMSETEGPETPDPVKETPPPQPPAAPEKEAATEQPPIIQDDEFTMARARRKKRPRPIPQGSNLPALQNHNHGSSLWGWLGLGFFIVLIIGGSIVFQSTISDVWPPSKKLYRVLGMDQKASAEKTDPVEEPPEPEKAKPKIPLIEQFRIVDIVPTKEMKDQVVTLIVKGNITNISDNTLSLPLIRISLKDDQGIILREWSFKVDASTIISGEKIPFFTSLPNPPEDATSISFIFIEN